MITKAAPIMVIYLPGYSLPNNNPSPIPPMMPTVSPIFLMLLILIPTSPISYNTNIKPYRYNEIFSFIQPQKKSLIIAGRFIIWRISMTIIVGLKCKDGVIIGSDSQQEFERGVRVKRLNTLKIHTIIDGKFAMAGAGDYGHVEKAIYLIEEGLREAFTKKRVAYLEEDECIDIIEKTMTFANKYYNIDRSKFLDDPEEKNYFDPILIVGFIESGDRKNMNTRLLIAHPDGLVERIQDYATAGSGAAYAELLLKNYFSDDLTLKEAIPLAVHTIQEVKSIDPSCGGGANLITITPNKGVTALSKEEIIDIKINILPALGMVSRELIPRILRGEINDKRLRKMLEQITTKK